MSTAFTPKVGRHCAICGKMGGSGQATALRLLLQAGAGADWYSPVYHDGKAHGPCVMREKRKLAKSTRGDQ